MRICSRTTSPLPSSHFPQRAQGILQFEEIYSWRCFRQRLSHKELTCWLPRSSLIEQRCSVCYILFSYHISSPPRSIYHFSPSDFSLTRSVCSSAAHSSFPPPLYSHMAPEPPFHSNLCSNVIHSEKSCLAPFVKQHFLSFFHSVLLSCFVFHHSTYHYKLQFQFHVYLPW